MTGVQTCALPISLKQVISEPTRVTSTSSTLIDHIYTNNEWNIRHSSVIRLSMSDHYLNYAIRKTGITPDVKRHKINFTDYSKLTAQNIRPVFTGTDWGDVTFAPSVDAMIQNFNTKYTSLVRSLTKQKTRFVKTDSVPPWLDSEVTNLMKLRGKYKESSDEVNYKKYRNPVTNTIARKKRNVSQS